MALFLFCPSALCAQTVRGEPREAGAGAQADTTWPVELPGVRVVGKVLPRSPRLRDFYRRAEAGRGYYVTREQIEEQRAVRFTDLIRGIPNLQIIPTSGGSYNLRFNRGLPSLWDRDCPIKYYIDGIEVPGSPNPDVTFLPKEIEGIEVYPGTNMPAQFGGIRAGCGVILIWTREEA